MAGSSLHAGVAKFLTSSFTPHLRQLPAVMFPWPTRDPLATPVRRLDPDSLWLISGPLRISEFDLRASMVASEPPGTPPGAH